MHSEPPDPLITNSGHRVVTAAHWRKTRRTEILEQFREHVYGNPPETRADLNFEVVDEKTHALGEAARRRNVTICISANGQKLKLHLLTILPKRDYPVPAFAFLNIAGNAAVCAQPGEEPSNPGTFPLKRIIERGYGVATAFCGDICPDSATALHRGAITLLQKPDAPPAIAWGAVGAWAWGLSRIMDYLVADREIDSTRIGVLGHSRLGKAALWAGAQDERFALVVSNNSGCTGAALSRGKKGETIKAINDQFPHWFCDHYKHYNDREEALPVDQHMLLALIAPRPLYVTSASEDSWADPSAEFRSCQLADPVYHLLGLQGIEAAQAPLSEHPLLNGQIGYHIRSGSHGLHDYDWERFMDFADLHRTKKQ